MFRRLVLVIALCSILHAAGPTGGEIIRRAIEAEKRQDLLRQQYIYREHQENRVMNSDGSPGRLYINRDFEDIFLEGAFYRKLVGIDGLALKPNQARAEDDKIRMTAAERRAARPSKTGFRTLLAGVPFSDIASVMDHHIVREEEVGAAKYWIVESTPGKDAVPGTPGEKRALAYRFVSWIDQADSTLLREEWQVIGDGQDTRPGSWVKIAFARNADGVNLIQRIEMKAISSKGSPARFFQTQIFSDYRKFTSETNVVFDGPPSP